MSHIPKVEGPDENVNWENEDEDVVDTDTEFDGKRLSIPEYPDSEITTEESIFAPNVYKSFIPYERFMQILLRYPCRSFCKDGIYGFEYKPLRLQALGYCVTSLFVAIITILVGINLIGILINYPPMTSSTPEKNATTLRLEEMVLFRSNLVSVIILLACLVHTTVANINFFLRRHFSCAYMNLWTQAAEMMKMDVAFGLRNYMWWMLFAYGTFLVIFFTVCALQIAPITTGGPIILSMLSLRIGIPDLHTLDCFYIIRTVAAFVYFYILISAKAYLFLFIYYCKLLKNGFALWNHRLDQVLHRGQGSLTRAVKVANRTGYDHLFQDHGILLDLLSGIDTLFTNIIESYYLTQVFSICFQVYYLYSCSSQTASSELSQTLKLDGIIIALYLIHTIVIIYLVSTNAVDVGEEAMDGLEIIRRKGMMGKKTDQELYFILSMNISYNGHFDMAIMVGKYFTLDKSFLAGITLTLLSYYIILSQFGTPLTLKFEPP